MKNEIICIVCPNSCLLMRDNEGNITGYLCKRGLEFAKQEFSEPKRSVTTTIKTNFKDIPVVSVRTDKEISKALIAPLLRELKKVVLNERLGVSDVVVSNFLNTGVNIIMTTNVLKE